MMMQTQDGNDATFSSSCNEDDVDDNEVAAVTTAPIRVLALSWPNRDDDGADRQQEVRCRSRKSVSCRRASLRRYPCKSRVGTVVVREDKEEDVDVLILRSTLCHG